MLSCKDMLHFGEDKFIRCARDLPHYAHRGPLSETEELEWYRNNNSTKIHLTYIQTMVVSEPVNTSDGSYNYGEG